MTPDVAQAMEQVNAVASAPDDRRKKISMVVMSGDMDKLFGAFIIGTGAAAMGMEVTMFFTFWGLRALKRADAKTGTTFFGKMMGAHNVATLPQLRDLAIDLGVNMYGCQMSMDVMEISQESFVKGVKDPVGVGFFIAEAQESQVTLFI